jgi:hypothetical protein
MIDTYASRHPMAEQALAELKEQRAWEAADSGRMSGHSRAPDFSDLDCMSDRAIVNEYLTQEESRRAYANDRR